MFIITDINNNKYLEGKNIQTWIDLPKDIVIKSILITLPQTKKYTPKLSINKFEKYYLYKEETYSSKVTTEAIVLGCIRKAFVYLYRIDITGNITMKMFPYSSLLKRSKEGKFDISIIRKGYSN